MADVLEDALVAALGTPDCPVVKLDKLALATNQSILTALCARYTGFPVGLHRYAVTRRASSGAATTLDLFVKVKPADTVLIAAGSELAEQCAPGLGALYARYSPQRELGGSHLREAAIYRLDMPRVQAFTPRVHATIVTGNHGPASKAFSILALEHLSHVELLADMAATDQWTDAHWHAAIDAAATLHAHWLGRDDQILAQPWIADNAASPGALAMMPWWQALARFAAADFSEWSGDDAQGRFDALHASMSAWWNELCAMPRTLIHNDFNPRNLAFRRTGGGDGSPRACVFDWELATLGVPQHDLAELLCFALPASADAGWVDAMIEHHRARVAAHLFERDASGPRTNETNRAPRPGSPTGLNASLPAAAWRRGVALCLNHLFIDRLPMYLLIHKLKPLPYLPRLLTNWQRLHRWLQP